MVFGEDEELFDEDLIRFGEDLVLFDEDVDQIWWGFGDLRGYRGPGGSHWSSVIPLFTL